MQQEQPRQPNFAINLKYRNKLPSAPYGPYFKNVDILTSLKTELPEYRTSTIEKNYVWQPHLGPFVGINIDLVDQDSILVTDTNQNLHSEDRKYINYVSNDKVKGKKTFDQQSKPWWLRNTTYLENNPFNKGSKLSEDDPRTRALELKKKLTNPNLDHYSTEYIDGTFTKVEETVKRLQAQNKDKKTLVASHPVMPLLEENISNINGSDLNRKRLHSLVRFDEDPKVVVNLVSTYDESAPKSKKYKIDDSVVTNVREPVKKDGVALAKGVDVTLVAPVMEDETYHQKKSEHLYEWVKDYRMEVHQDAANTNFVILLNEEENQVLYFPVSSRIDMKKLTLENSIPQDCFIIRE